MVLGLVLAIPAVALADNVVNDVVAGGNDTITAGGSTTINYRINMAAAGDPQAGCNVSDGTPATVKLNVPSGVTASATSLTFNACNSSQGVTFSSSTPGNYAISVSGISDAGGGGYNNQANFTLHVNAPPDAAAPTDASVVINDDAAWTNDANGAVSLDLSANDNVGVTAYRLAESQLGLASAAWVNVSPTTNFSLPNQSFTLSGSEAASKEVWLEVKDAQGNAATDSDEIGWDKTAPVITNVGADSTFSTPNAAGWYNTDVRHNFSATDNLSGFAGGGTTLNFHKDLTQEGSAVTISSDTVSDVAGNVGTAITSSPAYKIDKTDPTVTVTDVANNGTYTLGSVPAAGCDTQDQAGLSGVAQEATVSVTGGTANGVGTFTATCSGGKDVAGNTRDPVSVSYKVAYSGVSGILQPINYDDSSIFSRGKAVPVKFKLAGDEPNGFNYSNWKLERVKVSCTDFGDEGTTFEQIVENPSQTFRYDQSADQYIINANFKNETVGTCWRAKVTLDDNSAPMVSPIFKIAK